MERVAQYARLNDDALALGLGIHKLKFMLMPWKISRTMAMPKFCLLLVYTHTHARNAHARARKNYIKRTYTHSARCAIFKFKKD